jgi:hypothetical protein|tara:strand:+ start:26 stop:325 length:300 start_codon:yes stop_codon:yes gene_type:complete
MKSIKSKKSSRKPITPRRIKNLVKKALANGFKAKPAQGKVFLESLEFGSLFATSYMKGILINITDSSAFVIITQCSINEDESFYLGKRRIACKTEVTQV